MTGIIPYNAATRTSILGNAVKKKAQPSAFVPTKKDPTLPGLTKGAAPTNVNSLINKQYNLAQGKLNTQKAEASRSALENAQRAAAIRGTTGAGFETKINEKAVAEATKPYAELSTGLETERVGALIGAAQNKDQMKEQQRQFDFSANLQRFVTANEMDMNKLATTLNSITGLRASDVQSPSVYKQLFEKLRGDIKQA